LSGTSRLALAPDLGDSYTNGDVFDGINFRGAQLASDDNMLPDSQKGFAPVIHGIARGTAQVSVKQNGYEIYQSTVPPGRLPSTISTPPATAATCR
jgi:outer membrane usher protein